MADELAEIIRKLKTASDSERKAFKEALGADTGRGGKAASDVDYKSQADDLEAYIKKMDALGSSMTANVLKAQAEVEHKELLVKLAQQQVQEATNLTPELIKNLEEQQKALEVADETIKRFEKVAAKQQENIALSKDFGSSLSGAILPLKKTNFVGNLFKIKGALLGGAEGAQEFVKAFGTAVLDSIVGGLIDMALQLDSMESNIQRTTGANERFAKGMVDGADAISKYYVSNQEWEKSVTGLYSTMTEFSGEAKSVRIKLAETASILGKWGASAETIGKSFQFANKIMGQTSSQAAATSREMAAMAMDIGVPVDQMMQDFNTMMPALAKLGPTAGDSFKALAREAKKSGLEVQKILNLTDKFDTFEGAAEQTGKLNAALGGNFVNAMDMMTATDPIERFDMLKDSLDQAGLSFDDMSYYQRKFFAEQMGLDSVGDLALMMSGDMSNLGDEVGKTSSDYEDMAEKAAEQATLQEKWQGTMQQMMKDVLDSGFLDYLHDIFEEFRTKGTGPIATLASVVTMLADAFLWFAESGAMETIVNNLDWIIFTLLGLKGIQAGGMFIAMGKNTMDLAKGFGKTAEAAEGAVDAVKGTTDAVKGTADAASDLADAGSKAADAVSDVTGPMSDLADAGTDLADGPAGDVLGGIADNADKIAEVAPEAAAGNVAMGESTTFLGQVAALTWQKILALGGAIALMGLGVAVAALGVAELVKAFAPFDAGKIMAISFALLVFGASLAGMAHIMVGALPALTMTYGPILALGAAFLLMGIGVGLAAFGMSYLMDSMANVDAAKIFATALAFVALGYAMSGMAAALVLMGNPLAIAGLFVLAAVVAILTTAMSHLFAAIGSLSAAVLEPLAAVFQMMGSMDTSRIEKVSGEFKEIAKVLKEDMDLGAVTEMTEMLIELKKAGDVLSSMSSKQNSKDREVKIKLQLDAAATKQLLKGEATDTTATLTLEAFGQN
jgi:hypothetical protein